jgi:hypothetical protein
LLGALKDAIEQSFEDLREGVERKGERTPDPEAGAGDPPMEATELAGPSSEGERAGKDPLEAARETVEAVRDRFDFATRKDIDVLRAALDALEARVRALEGDAPSPSGRDRAPGPEQAPEPPIERPFRIDSE